MSPSFSIIDITPENAPEYGLCGYKSMKKEGLPEKIDWLSHRDREGVIIKSLVTDSDGTQGMIEYVPGEYCWRPISAPGYLVIHCIFVGFKKEYKRKGHGAKLLELCIRDAKDGGYKGVAAVVRKGAFMAGKELFQKKKFALADTAPPDFLLMHHSFDENGLNSQLPSFNTKQMEKSLGKYPKGVTIIRASQCPYTVKNVREIVEAAKSELGIDVTVVDLKNAKEAQKAPNPFGTFTLIIDGNIEAYHPISKTRFLNIIKKRKKS